MTRRQFLAASAVLVLFVLFLYSGVQAYAVVAHRGASGYLPEHTLAAYAYAHAQGADFLEPDLMMSSDGVLIALHDRTLNATTNAAVVFPKRARDDGLHYAVDFTMDELKMLTVVERNRDGTAAFPQRFPVESGLFTIPTLEELILLTQGLNKSTGRDVGIYPETKSSAWHRDQGLNLERALIELLAAYGYEGPDANVMVQSFEPESLKYIRFELGSELPLVQLIANIGLHAHMTTAEGLDEIATYAVGIGPAKRLIEDAAGNPVSELALVKGAHARGLVVHPWTFRSDALPAYADSIEDELRRFFFEYDVDGVFIDFPDAAVKLLEAAGYR